MDVILSKKERDSMVNSRFESLVSSGLNKTQATYTVMKEYGIASVSTVFNIRNRIRSTKEIPPVE